MRKVSIALIALLILLFSVGLSENLSDQTEELPIGFTEEELTRLDEIGKNHTRTAPPPSGEIYNCAEWDPSEGVIIRYPFGISYSLIAEMSEDVVVYTVVNSISQQNTVTSNYQANGVNMDNVEFIIAPTDSYWTRDYGPWFIFDGNGDFGIVDPIYNRPRPNDDAIPAAIGSQWSVPVYGMDLITAGGNYMSDGIGMAISTTLVQTENPGLTQDEIDSIINAYLGNDYVTYPDPLNEYIEHIDCWAKFLNPQTIMVLEMPTYHSQYDELNDAADFLATQISAWGEPYDIVRVFSTGSQAYINSLILNNKVFVPISGSAYDDDAIAAYEAAMPGYEVLGFSGSWYNTDALHCRSMGVPDREMLFLHHVPIFLATDTLNNYDIEVNIVDHSNTGLIADSLKIIYRINDGTWQFSMLTTAAKADTYEGYIPAQTYGTNIDYYIQAADNSDRVETHPYIGAPGAHTFDVLNPAPQIILSQTIFNFETHYNSKSTLYDTLQISNGGLGTLDWSVSNNSSWLDLLPISGTAPSDVELIVTTDLLAVGTHYDTITVISPEAENSPQTVEVILTVNPEIPEVIATSPENDENEVQTDADITVTFSINMNPATITPTKFLISPGGDVLYDGTVSYDSPSRTATIDIIGEFFKGEHIFVTVDKSISSAEGQPLEEDFIFGFWVEVNTPPDAVIPRIPENLAENMSIDTDLIWSGNDPDGDPIQYSLYFGTTNPPPILANQLTDSSYTLNQLEYNIQYFWQVITFDDYSYTMGPLTIFTTEVFYICGDANADTSINVSDAVFIINYVFVSGSPVPDPIESADVNCDTKINVSDAVFIINFVFASGNDPCDLDGDDIPDC